MIRSINIYYSDIDKLILEFAVPCLRHWSPRLHRTFFERRCLEGRNLRIRLESDDEGTLAEACTAIEHQARHYLKQHPSATLPSLSSDAAAKLAEIERAPHFEPGQQFSNQVFLADYERESPRDGSPELLDLLHTFLDKSSRLAALALQTPEQKFERFLEVVFLSTFLFGETPAEGAVTYHAHWAVLAHWFEPRALIRHIVDSYPQRREHCRRIFHRVRNDRQNPFLSNTAAAINEAIRTAHGNAQNLAGSIEYAATVDTLKSTYQLLDKDGEGFPFLDTLYADGRYLADVTFNPAVQVTRLTVNLLYHFAAQLGLRAVDRFAACYYVQQTIAEESGANYQAILSGFVTEAQERARRAVA